MKVCVLAPRFPYPENGGDVVLINDIMQYFKDIGYDVILLSYYEQGQVCYISRHYKNIDKIIAIKRNKFSSFFYSLFIAEAYSVWLLFLKENATSTVFG